MIICYLKNYCKLSAYFNGDFAIMRRINYQVFRSQSLTNFMKENAILVLTVGGTFLGLLAGFIIRSQFSFNLDQLELIKVPGDAFMNAMNMLTIPLLISSVISGISQMEGVSFDRVGVRTLMYFMCSAILAVLSGITIAYLIQPCGGYKYFERHSAIPKAYINQAIPKITKRDLALNFIRNIFLLTPKYESISPPEKNKSYSKIKTLNCRYQRLSRKVLLFPNSPNIIGLITASILFGVTVQKMGPTARIFKEMLNFIDSILMRISTIIMWYSPIGIMSMLIANIVVMENVSDVIARLSLYVITILIASCVHCLICLPLLFMALTGQNPFKYMANIVPALGTAFGTGTSLATLPITMTCVEKENAVDVRISRFVLPLGALINMDGTGLYEAAMAICLAQTHKISYSRTLLNVSITSLLMNVGSLKTTSNHRLVNCMIMLNLLKLPMDDMTLLIATIDWLLDRFRAITNVLSDSLGAGIVHSLSLKDLKILETRENSLNQTTIFVASSEDAENVSALSYERTFRNYQYENVNNP